MAAESYSAFTRDGWYEAGAELLAAGKASALNIPPERCHGDRRPSALRDHRLDVRGEVSVTGLDGGLDGVRRHTEGADQLSALTTVRCPAVYGKECLSSPTTADQKRT